MRAQEADEEVSKVVKYRVELRENEGVSSAEYCYNSRHGDTYYCVWGCCGDIWNQYCCNSMVGIIVGSCFGGLILISLIIAGICCCIKQQGKSGRVIGTTGSTTVAYVGTNYSTPAGYSGHPYPAGSAIPPPYQSHASYPPGAPPSEGLYDDPAYPPGRAPPPYKE